MRFSGSVNPWLKPKPLYRREVEMLEPGGLISQGLARSFELCTVLELREWPGERGPLVCVGPRWMTLEHWGHLARAVSPAWRVFALGPAAAVGIGYQVRVAELVGFLEAWGFASPVLVAYGVGAMCGLSFASLFPGRIQSLILLEGATQIRPPQVSRELATLMAELLRAESRVDQPAIARIARNAAELRLLRQGLPSVKNVQLELTIPTLVVRAASRCPRLAGISSSLSDHRAMLRRMPHATTLQIKGADPATLLTRDHPDLSDGVRSFLHSLPWRPQFG